MFYVCAHMYFYILRSRSQTFWSRKHRGIGLVISVIIHLLSSFIQWRTLVWLFLFLFRFSSFLFLFWKGCAICFDADVPVRAPCLCTLLICHTYVCFSETLSVFMCTFISGRCLVLLWDALNGFATATVVVRAAGGRTHFHGTCAFFFLLIFVLFVFQGWMGSSSAQTRWTPHAARPSPDSWRRATPAQLIAQGAHGCVFFLPPFKTCVLSQHHRTRLWQAAIRAYRTLPPLPPFPPPVSPSHCKALLMQIDLACCRFH